MPTVYVDTPFRKLIRVEVKRLERERRKQLDDESDVYVSEKEGLEELLSDDAKERLKRKRENNT